jgi:hypothetical protein
MTPPLTPEEAAGAAYMKRLYDIEKAGERMTVSIGPFTAMVMIGALQMSTRHPDMDLNLKKVLRQVIDQMRPTFAGTEGEEIVNKGDHPEWDYPR